MTIPEAPTSHSSWLAKVDWYEIARLLIVLLIVIAFGYATYWITKSVETSKNPETLNKIDDLKGLSPAIQACYAVHSRISSIIIAGAFGAAIGITYVFGNFLYWRFRSSIEEERRIFWEGISAQLARADPSELPHIVLGFTAYEKVILHWRNLYWALFLRSTLALLVVTVIALLIAACKIEAQAGLPIIAGVIAFIIGQTSHAFQPPEPNVIVAGRPASPLAAGSSEKNPLPSKQQP